MWHKLSFNKVSYNLHQIFNVIEVSLTGLIIVNSLLFFHPHLFLLWIIFFLSLIYDSLLYQAKNDRHERIKCPEHSGTNMNIRQPTEIYKINYTNQKEKKNNNVESQHFSVATKKYIVDMFVRFCYNECFNKNMKDNVFKSIPKGNWFTTSCYHCKRDWNNYSFKENGSDIHQDIVKTADVHIK